MSESTEVTGPLIRALRQARILTMRMQSGQVKVRGAWMHLCESGTADILCFPPNQPPTWIETKTKDGKQSSDQVAFGQRVIGMGHRLFVVRSVDEGLQSVLGK